MSPHVVDQLSAYLDQELSVAEASVVREHLAGCEACAERLAHLVAVDVGVRDLPVVAPAGYFDSFASRVRTRVEATSRPRARFQLPAWSWAVAAAVLLAVIVPRLPFGSDGPAPVPAQQTAATDATTRSAARARADAGAPAAAAESDRLREIADSEPPAEAGARAKKELLEGGALSSNANAPRPPAVAPPFASAPPPQATPPARSTPPPAPQTRTAQALPAAPAPAPAAAPAAKATGFAEGKTDAVSEEAQVAAADASFRDEVRTQVAAAERSDLEKDKRQNEGAPGAKPQAALAGAGRSEEALKLRRASGEKAASAAGGSAAAEFEAIEAEAQKNPAIPLAQQREAWRSFAERHRDDPSADEARVRVVALGVDLARQTGDEADRALAQKDAADYLSRRDALQKKRVLALLAALTR